MDFRDYLRLLRRRWVTVLVVLVACLAGAVVVTALQPPTYRATTQVLVALPQGGVSASDPAGSTVSYTSNLPQVVASFATLAGTAPVVTAVVDAAGLPAGTPVALTASAVPGTAVLGVAVDAADSATARAAAAVFADTFPDVLVTLGQISSTSALDFQTLSPVNASATPYSPRPVLNTAIGLAVGLVLGLAVAVAREAVDRRIRDSRGIEERVGVAVLGVVPHELGDVPLPSATHPDAARSEAYRKVRTSLLFSSPGGMVRSLAVTSPVAGEGKTSLVVNLAVVCARAGQKVAVVDADLRRPTVHEKFGLPNTAGLSTVIAGEAELRDVVHVDVDGVAVLCAGPVPRDPSAMLESPVFREVVEALEKTYDIVLLDTTPALAVSDAAQVCTVAQGSVLVSRLRRTTYDSLGRACRTLERVHSAPLGIVAVGHDEDPDAGYRYYYAAPGGEAPRRGSHRKGGAEPTAADWRRRGPAG